MNAPVNPKARVTSFLDESIDVMILTLRQIVSL